MLTTQDTQKDNSFAEARKQTEEYKRLQEVREQNIPWKKWGPYLSDRQWATMREYYGEEDKAWGYFSHDEARNRSYRWGEDGIFGISDECQRLCFALTLWNGKDELWNEKVQHSEKHLKERFFGLPGMWGQNQGNHMEDVKEYYFYLDNTPTHSYMKALYKYPYKFPYDDLIEENNKRGKDKPEYELIDTNCFDEGYFDVVVEYAKKTPEDILIKITVWNQGNGEHDLHILPTLWFRNTWSWGQLNDKKPSLKIINDRQFKNELADVKNNEFVLVEADCHNPKLKSMYFYCEKPQEVLFTDNETGKKNAIEQYIFNQDAEQSRQQGTKFSAHYFESILPHKSTKNNRKVIRLRLSNDPNKVEPFANDFEEIFGQRQKEADAFYEAITPFRISDSDEERQIQRQAFAGMLWNKQFYYYVVQDWLQGDFLYHRHRIYPDHEMPKPDKRNINSQWTHLHNENIISMPDKWEYPYYCVWDSAFHAVTFALIDPDFAKEQLCLFTQPHYMKANGQIPSCEFDFNQIHPPILAWAALQVYEIERNVYDLPPDRRFLQNIFDKLVKNFDWWFESNKLDDGKYLFNAGFLGLDNISIVDRNQFLKDKSVTIEQVDATAWVGMFCLNMLKIATEIGKNENLENQKIFQILSVYFLGNFIQIVHEINENFYRNDNDRRVSLWDTEDNFYYEVLKISLEKFSLELPLKYRSILGIIPMFSVEVFTKDKANSLTQYLKNEFHDRNSPLAKFTSEEDFNYLFGQEECVDIPQKPNDNNPNDRELFLSIVNKKKLQNIIDKLLDKKEFLSEYGIRSLSKFHEEHPYQLDGLLRNMYQQTLAIEMKYEPGESKAPIHTGNSNWRGPIWFPINFLIIDSLKKYYNYFNVCLHEEDFKVLFPAISHSKMTLKQVALELSQRLIKIFLPDESGKRPVYGDNPKLRELFKTPDGQDLILFYEYFHGDTGQGLGASHQTGWTGLVANLIYQVGEYNYLNSAPS